MCVYKIYIIKKQIFQLILLGSLMYFSCIHSLKSPENSLRYAFSYSLQNWDLEVNMYNITDLISGITNIWLQSFDSWFRSLELITLYQIIIEKVKGEKGKVLPAEKNI